jgi:hypothetical protein
MLSKSKYTRAKNCLKSLWLYINKKEERFIDAGTQAIFSRGTDIGVLAQQYFPEGKMAVLEDYPGYESAKRTQEFIEQGIETIYEATFIYDNTLVAVDILSKVEGEWTMYEVKSTNSVKPQHIIDVAVQYYVIKGSGMPIKKAHVMHLNKEYVRRGDLDIRQLFITDTGFVQKAIEPLQAQIAVDITRFTALEKEPEEPNIPMGPQCTSPYTCDFYNYCSSQQATIEEETMELSSTPNIHESAVKSFVDSVQYPLCHLDFETVMPAVPMFDESRPYQQLPFQYSLHFQQTKGGELTHAYYLAESDPTIDPRKGLIQQMIEQTIHAKTIFVYSLPFERGRINEMMRDFPEHAADLQSISERLLDLIIPFKQKFYRTETMGNSSSIKKVLPALHPEFSYADLEISDGMAASFAFLDLYSCNDEEIISQTRENLLKYCHLDTLAMVKIFEVLEGV